MMKINMGGRKSQASKLNANSLRRTVVVVISLLVALSQIFFIQHPFMLLEHHQVQNDQVAAEHPLDPPAYSGDERSYVALCLSVKGKQRLTTSLYRAHLSPSLLQYWPHHSSLLILQTNLTLESGYGTTTP
jgi:hypothetical protein